MVQPSPRPPSGRLSSEAGTMGATTFGVKVDDELRARLKAAAQKRGRTPHWLVKQAILSMLDRLERGGDAADPFGEEGEGVDLVDGPSEEPALQRPFRAFAQR